MHHFFEAITNTSGESLIGYFARVIDPASLNVVTLSADDNGTPISTVSGVTNAGKTDDYGNLSFYVEPGTYHLDIYAADATTFVYRVPNVAMNSTKGDKGDPGDTGEPGPANNTFTTPEALAASPITNSSATLAPTDPGLGYLAGNFRYVLNYPAAANGVDIIQSTVGAGKWVNTKRGILLTTFDFGGVGDGAYDDTAAIKAQNAYCETNGFPVILGTPPVRWRITDTITSRAASWRGAGQTVPVLFDPPNPDSLPDMTPCFDIYDMNGAIVDIQVTGPHNYNVQDPSTYVADFNSSPHAADGGWYQDFFKPGTCAFRVNGTARPSFERVWTSSQRARSFKVGIYFDVVGGHITFNRGCQHFDLIGHRVGRNSDDFMWRGEPIMTGGFCGILIGTRSLNGTFNGGCGMREANFYIGQCPYGILQMNDHGPKGTPYPLINGQSSPYVESLYGTLDGSFFEFLGEAAVQMLPNSICRDLSYQDMQRFTWEDAFRLPASIVPLNERQLAAFRFGRLGRNCRFGTLRSKPNYVTPYDGANPGKSSLRFEFVDADQSTIVAQQLLATTIIVSASAGGRIFDNEGRVIHEGDLRASQDLATHGNLLTDWFNGWIANSGPVPTPAGSAGSFGTVPNDMKKEMGPNPAVYRFSGDGLRTLNVVNAPNSDLQGRPLYDCGWVFMESGTALIFIQTNNGRLYEYTIQGQGWQRVAIGGGQTPDAPVVGMRININGAGSSMVFAGFMMSVDVMRPFNRASNPTASTAIIANGGMVTTGFQRFFGLPTTTTAPAAGGAGALPAAPTGYITVQIDGTDRRLPYY